MLKEAIKEATTLEEAGGGGRAGAWKKTNCNSKSCRCRRKDAPAFSAAPRQGARVY